MDSLIETCHAIGQILNKKPGAGADDFLPILIFALIRSKVPAIPSTIDYLQRFCNPAILLSEPGYCLTNLAGAAYFIENSTSADLNIVDKVFCAYYQRARRQNGLPVDHRYCLHDKQENAPVFSQPQQQPQQQQPRPQPQQPRPQQQQPRPQPQQQPKPQPQQQPKPQPQPQPQPPKVEEEEEDLLFF